MSSASARFSSSSRSMRSIKDFKRSPAMPPTSGIESPLAFGYARDPNRARASAQGAASGCDESAASVAVAGDRLLVTGLMLRLPLFVGHAVDDLARLCIGQRDAAFFGGLAVPARQAVAAEAGEIHELEVLHVAALAQMLDQAAEGGGFKVGAGRVVHGASLR